MIVGVVADSHDRLPAIDGCLRSFRAHEVEAVIHAGDFVAPFALRPFVEFDRPLHATLGNNDGERAGLRKLHPQLVDGPLFLSLGRRIVLVHHFIDWIDAADVARADVVITGHTHEVVNEREGGRLLLNPGECCGWLTGRCTAAILNLETMTAEIIDVAA